METLSKEFPVKILCELMHVSRSGYYKWKQHKDSKRNINFRKVIEAVSEVHCEHSTHGYRWTAAYIRLNKCIQVCDNYVYKCYRILGLQAQTKHKVHYKPRKEKDKYPNLIYSTWETVDRPLQVVVSDMTAFKIGYMLIEVTFYFDVFTKEILTYQVADRRGSRWQYIKGLEEIITQVKGVTLPLILHTDQGSVYASIAYNELIKNTNIVRSMSRAGKPTDNPVNEALNGWIKEELMQDFKLAQCNTIEQIKNTIERYVKYYNTQRPCYAIGYNTPEQYRIKYNNEELLKKNTFEKRQLSPEPKFVRKRKDKAYNQQIIASCPLSKKEI